jgi:protease I
MATFVPAMLATFTQTAPEPSPTAPGQASDPQRNTPTGMAIAALRWSPKPSVTAVVGIGLVAAAWRALRDPAAQS